MTALKKLEKNYSRLTPAERLELLVAARARGDQAEIDRLEETAPQLRYKMSHHFGLGEALTRVAAIHLINRMERAGAVMVALAFLDRPEAAPLVLPLLTAYAEDVAGWEKFCHDLGMEPNAVLCFNPEDSASLLTVGLLIPRVESKQDPTAISAIAAEYRRIYNDLASFWPGHPPIRPTPDDIILKVPN